jgi:hypothetical protein
MASTKITGVRIPSSALTKINRGPALVATGKRIAENAAVIAHRLAKAELGTKPGSTSTGVYANGFKVVKTTGDGKTTWVLRNETMTRPTRGRQRPQRFLAPIIERGSKPHEIKAKNVNNLFFMWDKGTDGKGFFRGPKVNHPGTKGHRFAQRAMEKAIRDYKRTL